MRKRYIACGAGLIGSLVAIIGGATIGGWANTVSHHHPTNHALEGGLIATCLCLIIVGILGAIVFVIAAGES